MHYYQHHIGDFIKDTSFLTNEEVGIYLKLLWLYYDTEKPLSNSLFELSMKVNARDQQDSLSGILEMFFTLENNQWHHTRCEKEIQHYHQQLNTASKAGKASAAKRALNKKLTTVERPLESCSTDVQPTNNQQPITNNHKPYSVAKATGDKSPMSPDEIIFSYGVPLLTNAGTPDKQARSFLGGLRKSHGDEALVNALRECVRAKPLQPLEWLAKVLPPDGMKPKLNKQEALEASNRAVVERLLKKEGLV